MFGKKANAFLVIVLLFAAIKPVLAKEKFSSEDLDFFESKVRPLLAERCYKCHSHKAKKLKGDLYLDSRKGLLHGGDNGPAVKPGDLAGSLLIDAIRYRDPDLQMPPKTKLSEREIEILERWVELGAPWPEEEEPKGSVAEKKFDMDGRKASHWSWQAVSKPSLPVVKDAKWGELPIDRFILEKLEKAGLPPGEAADPRTILRRLTFDLRGMPPSAQEVKAFVEDDSPDAYEKVVDRLLASPQFGEKWARHWMDLFRYAESRGHEFDYNTPNAFRYRDYLIRSLNDDLPYDQFVTEHVAGDVLESPRVNPQSGANESVLATGFWFLGEWIHSPVDTRQDEADRFDNMIGVFSKSFLGLTIACARCHDHKFDAISTKDFYALQGYLQSSGYRQVRYESMVQNEDVSRKLDELERSSGLAKKVSSLLVEGTRHSAKYMLAAGKVLRGEVGEADLLKEDKPTADGPIVFADFEDGTYGKWFSTGTAFGKGPVTLATKAEYQKDVRPQGKYFVNSHNVRKDPANANVRLGDDQLGTLTSPRFRIERDYVTFLIGGGSFKKETCVNLLIDGKAVLSATGRSNNTMFETVWDVRKWKGSEARLQVVDKRQGSWGNVGLDHVVFTNQAKASPVAVIVQSGFKKETVTAYAKSEGLDDKILQAWVDSLESARKDRASLLAPLVAVLGAKKPDWSLVRSTSADATNRRTRYKEALGRLELAVNYASPRPGDFMQDGVTFGRRPKLPGDLLLNESGDLVGMARWGMARRDPVWKGLRIVDSARDSGGGLNFVRAGITLRTPTFTNLNGDAHYLLRGKGKAVAVVDSHRLIQGPLHRNASIDVGRPGQLAWASQDLDRKGQTYLGHRLHVEFTPTTGDDFEVLMIDLSTDSGARNEVMAYLNNPPNPLYAGMEKLEELPTREQLTDLVASNLQSVAAKLADGLGSEPQSMEWAKIANWLVQRKDALGLGDSIPGKEFLDRHRQLRSEIKRDSRTAMAMLDGSADDEYVFVRGNHRSRGEDVPRRFIEALGGLDEPAPKVGSGRLELARQITDPKRTPFVTRVLANRLWHHLFGRGIVASTDDFGVLGQRPTHPELLDYLASRLVEHQWSVKALIKEIVMSRSYRMSSLAGGDGEEKDPANLLWRRANVRRLQAEAIRDSLLFLSGRLDSKMYGPPVSTYLTDFMQGRGRPGQGPLDGGGRRSVYLSVRRNFLSPFMLAFDAPSPFNAVGRRTTSNVPSQALILMNDPFVVGQADLWAKRIRGQATETDERIRMLYEAAFSRMPSELEMDASLAFLASQAKLHGVPEDNDLPWKDLVHAIINAKEFIYLN